MKHLSKLSLFFLNEGVAIFVKGPKLKVGLEIYLFIYLVKDFILFIDSKRQRERKRTSGGKNVQREGKKQAPWGASNLMLG